MVLAPSTLVINWMYNLPRVVCNSNTIFWTSTTESWSIKLTGMKQAHTTSIWVVDNDPASLENLQVYHGGRFAHSFHRPTDGRTQEDSLAS